MALMALVLVGIESEWNGMGPPPGNNIEEEEERDKDLYLHLHLRVISIGLHSTSLIHKLYRNLELLHVDDSLIAPHSVSAQPDYPDHQQHLRDAHLWVQVQPINY